jgi:hypothetical protein
MNCKVNSKPCAFAVLQEKSQKYEKIKSKKWDFWSARWRAGRLKSRTIALHVSMAFPTMRPSAFHRFTVTCYS